MPSTAQEKCELFAVELRTTRWEEMVLWYREVLGLRVLVRVLDDKYALLAAGTARLAILHRPKHHEPSARMSLAFEVANLTRTAARLRAAGAHLGEPHDNAEGLTDITTHDPDGNRIRLFSWKKR